MKILLNYFEIIMVFPLKLGMGILNRLIERLCAFFFNTLTTFLFNREQVSQVIKI